MDMLTATCRLAIRCQQELTSMQVDGRTFKIGVLDQSNLLLEYGACQSRLQSLKIRRAKLVRHIGRAGGSRGRGELKCSERKRCPGALTLCFCSGYIAQHRSPPIIASRMSSFLTFLRDRGAFVHPKLKLFCETDDNGDRGVIVNEDIPEGQQLMLIPLQCCLHMPTREEWARQQVGYCASCRSRLTTLRAP